jgi:hypothetical protein
VKAECANKSSEFIERKAYGFARDVMNKAFPLFGAVNIIARGHLPNKMTRYMLSDPGDASRAWATLWVGVAPNGWHYIYRDWPDAQTYGEWAVPSSNPLQPDGDRGDAQREQGFGVKQYADEWRRLEKLGLVVTTPEGIEVARPDLRDEVIFDRYTDPRAANNPHIELHGGTNLYQKFAEVEPPMLFLPWSGVEIAIGYTHVNSLLYWNPEQPLSTPDNCPKLYVTEDCKQVIWMFSNFTGQGGAKAGGKDFADLVRGMALADLQYYESNEFKSSGGGSY